LKSANVAMNFMSPIPLIFHANQQYHHYKNSSNQSIPSTRKSKNPL
jgi:hypothetical protein